MGTSLCVTMLQSLYLNQSSCLWMHLICICSLKYTPVSVCTLKQSQYYLYKNLLMVTSLSNFLLRPPYSGEEGGVVRRINKPLL